LEVRASTNSPASCFCAVSTIGVNEPKPRYGLAVTASTARDEEGSR